MMTSANVRAQDVLQLMSFLYYGHAIISNHKKTNISKFRALLDQLDINSFNCEEKKNERAILKMLQGTTFENAPNKMTVDFSFEAATKRDPQIVLYYDVNFDLKSELNSVVNMRREYCSGSAGMRMILANGTSKANVTNQVDGVSSSHESNRSCDNNGVSNLNGSENQFCKSPVSINNSSPNAESNGTDVQNDFEMPVHGEFRGYNSLSTPENSNNLDGNCSEGKGKFNTNDNLDIVDYEVEIATSEDNSEETETGQDKVTGGYQCTLKNTQQYHISGSVQQFQFGSENRDSLDKEDHRKERIDNDSEGTRKQEIATCSNGNGPLHPKGINQTEVRSFKDLESIVKTNVSFFNGEQSRKSFFVTVIECDDAFCESDNCSNVKKESEKMERNDLNVNKNLSGGSFGPYDVKFSHTDNENIPPGEQSTCSDRHGPLQRFFKYLHYPKDLNLKENFRNHLQDNSGELNASVVGENNRSSGVEHFDQKLVGGLDFHMTETNEALFRDNIEVLTEVLTNVSPLKKDRAASTPRQQTSSGENHSDICYSNTSIGQASYHENNTYEMSNGATNNDFLTSLRKHGKRDRRLISCSRSKRKQVLNERPCDSDIDFFDQTNGPPSVEDNNKRRLSNKPYRRSLRRLDFNTFAYKRIKTKPRTMNIENHSSDGQAKELERATDNSSTNHSVTFRSMLRDVQMSLTNDDEMYESAKQEPTFPNHVPTAFDCSRMNSFLLSNAQVPRQSGSYRSSAEQGDRVRSVSGRKEPSVDEWCSDGDSDTEATVSVDYSTSPECFNSRAQEGKCFVIVHE